ncbi:MAG: hypothetical protein HC930_16985 [Hydrococcus sp. SU_1_0]|nr:hypothetical protein [Hydrococcus sp. SU_1_0]
MNWEKSSESTRHPYKVGDCDRRSAESVINSLDCHSRPCNANSPLHSRKLVEVGRYPSWFDKLFNVVIYNYYTVVINVFND